MPRFERNVSAKLEIEEVPITHNEIKAAIKGLKQGKCLMFTEFKHMY